MCFLFWQQNEISHVIDAALIIRYEFRELNWLEWSIQYDAWRG